MSTWMPESPRGELPVLRPLMHPLQAAMSWDLQESSQDELHSFSRAFVMNTYTLGWVCIMDLVKLDALHQKCSWSIHMHTAHPMNCWMTVSNKSAL